MEKSSSLTTLTLAAFFILIITLFITLFSFTEDTAHSEKITSFYPIKSTSYYGLNHYPIFFNDDIETAGSQMDQSVIIQKMSEYISKMKLTHITADTIKRILLAHLNGASLILNDNDSDNDSLICSNIIPKFISDIQLYEDIKILKADQANKIHQQIDVLKDFSCNLN